MTPEMLLEKPYNGQNADLFAATIVLFLMYVGTPPFLSAISTGFIFIIFNKIIILLLL